MATNITLLVWWLALGTAEYGPSTTAPPPPDAVVNNLRKRLTTVPPDSNRVLLLAQLAYEHTQTDPLATIAYSRPALA